MKIEDIAQVAHEINMAYCQSIGDYSQVPWGEAQEWQKQSAVNGVLFQLENPGLAASASHENWLKEKLADGWKYGPVKDVEKKEHPCCVPYEDLPLSQQSKDYLFKQVVASLTKYADLYNEAKEALETGGSHND
jgi:RyR domain